MKLAFEDALVRRGGFSLGPLDHRIDSERAEVIVVVGPNGAGKTTLLNAMAGLIGLERGRVVLDGAEISALPPQARRIGYVSQEPYLFPNISVERNVLYGASDRTSAERWMSELGIADISERRPASLSGGQQQRVSIARALATNPRLVLFDEPFSHLDREIQEELRVTVRRMAHREQVNAIYVTHSVDEAYSVADRLLFIDGGRFVETISPAAGGENVASKPRTKRFAELLGYKNMIGGQVVDSSAGLVRLSANGLILEGIGDGEVGSDATLAVRPEDVAIFAREPSALSQRNVIPVKVTGLVPKGGLTELAARNEAHGMSIAALLTTDALNELAIRPGSYVYAVFKAAAAHLVSEG